ncbi:MAG: pyrroline-5-carboxylate reductase [Gammaproteobacteria bacterium]|nr:MAG: pyrroline-5-carboxylate reductase [Gammaproteobacteria bacterium]
MTDGIISFIGGGNMATSLIGGLIAGGRDPASIYVSDPERATLEALADAFRVQTSTDNEEAVSHASTVVFAVKPQIMATVVKGIAVPARAHRPLFVSVAAGVREPDILRWLGFDAAIVRSMPNTPALVGSGATALHANSYVSDEQRNLAESLLRAVGLTLWVEDESLLDAVTGLSGSGPAYYFLLMEYMERAGISMGLSKNDARVLTIQTAFGAAKMALESNDSPATLRTRVTSPGGTTERALDALMAGGMEHLVHEALEASRDRAVELGHEFGRDPGPDEGSNG